MKKHRKKFVNFVERELNCELIEANANLLHFRAKINRCPSVADIERVLSKTEATKRDHNILFECLSPKSCEVMFIFAGMINIPTYLIKTFGGQCYKPHIWYLHNMSMYTTDQRGYRQTVAPDVTEIKEHIHTIYQLLNPNCKRRDFHKRVVKLLSYNEELNMWECGNDNILSTVFVDAPSYLSSGSGIYINTYKKSVENYGKIFEYYGKGLCNEVKNNDYVQLFALKPDAVYDWFYSQERNLNEIIDTLKDIEYSFVHRPWLYYCKGEYTKVRQLFLMETFRWVASRPTAEVKNLPTGLKLSLFALADKDIVASCYYLLPTRNLLDEF